MYDGLFVRSASAVLGSSRIRIDPDTNAIFRDLQYPLLEDLSIKEVIQGFSPAVSISVTASDNWGIASVRVYAGNSYQDNWVVLDCEEQHNVWTILSSDLEEGETQFYVEIMDEAGNVLITDNVAYYIEFGDLLIPFFPIMGLLTLALVTGIGVSVIVKRKNRWT
jgi:hypothetical protein